MAPKKGPPGSVPGETPRPPTDREFTEAFAIPADTDYRVDYDNYRGQSMSEDMSPEEIAEYNGDD